MSKNSLFCKKFDQLLENKEQYIFNSHQTISKQKETMNKGQLIEAVQKNLGKDTKAAAEAAVNAVIASIQKAVKKGLFKLSVWYFFSCEACCSYGHQPTDW